MDGSQVGILVAAAVVGYMVGAINPATIIARARGVDLKAIGSGNPGATNASRAMGKKTGILIGFLDVLKGFLPAILFAVIGGTGAAEMAGFAAVVGHITSPFLRGRGGKGVATTLGAVLGAQPLWVPFILIAFGLGLLISKRVGIGAVCGAVVLFAAAWFTPGFDATLFGIGISLLVLVRHGPNIAAAWREWRRPAAV
jgi:glycerol-3-phosphate acyltransferase PlsY